MSLSENTKLLTKDGLKKIKDLSKKSEIWDGTQFVEIDIIKNKEKKLNILHLSDGSKIECTDDFILETNDGSNIELNKLSSGIKIKKNTLNSLISSTSSGSISSSNSSLPDLENIELAYNNGKEFSKHINPDKKKLPKYVYKYGEDEFLYFMAGWIDNNEIICANKEIIEDIQILFKNYGIDKTMIEENDKLSILYIDEKSGKLIPNPYCKSRIFTPINDDVYISYIEKKNKKSPTYNLKCDSNSFISCNNLPLKINQ